MTLMSFEMASIFPNEDTIYRTFSGNRTKRRTKWSIETRPGPQAMMPSAIAAQVMMDRPAVGHGEFDDRCHEQQAERGKARAQGPVPAAPET